MHRTDFLPVFFLFFFFSVLLVLGAVHIANAQQGGSITVTVINQVTNEALPGQDVVLLRHMDETESMKSLAEGRTDSAGRYTFTELPVDNAHYAVTTRYLNIDYTSEHLTLQDGAATQTVQLGVYDTTQEEAAVSINMHHMVVETSPDVLNITEFFVFNNSGNETFAPVAGIRSGLRLSLPAGAFQIQALVRGIESDGPDLFYTNPVPPGPAQVVYAYSLDRRATNGLVSKRIEYDTDRIQVMAFPSNQTVTGADLVSKGERQIGDKTYLLMESTAQLPRGKRFEIQFPGSIAWQDIMKWGMIALFVLMAIVGVSVGIKKQREKSPVPEEPSSAKASEDQEDEDFQSLLQRIAELDDRFEAGDMDQETYHRRRRDLKDRAVRLRMTEDTDE